MKKNSFKIKFSTILTVICCALAAVFCWLCVKYVEPTETIASIGSSLWC